MLTGKSSSLLALNLSHSNKLETVFKKPKQAVSLPSTTRNEIASSFFYLTSYIGGNCLEILRRSTSLKKVSCSLSVRKTERGDASRQLPDKAESCEHHNCCYPDEYWDTSVSFKFLLCEGRNPGFIFLCNSSCVVVVG